MVPQLVRRLYAPEFLVKDNLKQGEIPNTKTVYANTVSVAWASIVESFLISLIAMTATVMVSGIGEEAIAAVGLATQPRFIVQTLVMALNISVTSIAARRRGENDREGAVNCLKQGILLSTACALLMSLIAAPTARPLLLFAGAKADTIDMATQYFLILLIGIPFNSISLTISAAQRGVGNTRASMVINIVTNIVSMGFNFLLIEGRMGFPRLEVAGAGVATVIGWLAGFAVAIFSVAHRNQYLFVFTKNGWNFDKRTLRAVYKVSSGSFLDQICMRIGFLVNSIIIANLGTMMFAAHQILINLLQLSFCFGEGYGIASSSLVGQNMGAKRSDMSIVYGNACQRMSLVTSTTVFIVLTVFGRQMLTMFTADEGIITTGNQVMYLLGLIIFAQSSQMIFFGSLRGAGDTHFTAIVSLICIMIVRPGLSYLFAFVFNMGLFGVWVAFFVDQYMRLALTFLRFSSGKWMKIAL